MPILASMLEVLLPMCLATKVDTKLYTKRRLLVSQSKVHNSTSTPSLLEVVHVLPSGMVSSQRGQKAQEQILDLHVTGRLAFKFFMHRG